MTNSTKAGCVKTCSEEDECLQYAAPLSQTILRRGCRRQLQPYAMISRHRVFEKQTNREEEWISTRREKLLKKDGRLRERSFQLQIFKNALRCNGDLVNALRTEL